MKILTINSILNAGYNFKETINLSLFLKFSKKISL